MFCLTGEGMPKALDLARVACSDCQASPLVRMWNTYLRGVGCFSSSRFGSQALSRPGSSIKVSSLFLFCWEVVYLEFD